MLKENHNKKSMCVNYTINIHVFPKITPGISRIERCDFQQIQLGLGTYPIHVSSHMIQNICLILKHQTHFQKSLIYSMHGLSRLRLVKHEIFVGTLSGIHLVIIKM